MPTGYTDCVGKGATFEEFVLGCSRAFGALVDMRDAPSDAEIPDKIEPSTYHDEKLVEVKKELEKFKSMSLEEATVEAQKKFEEEVSDTEESITKNALTISRYKEMLDKVKSWNPPTREHTNFKKFMIEQLDSSISFDDMGDYYKKHYPVLLSAEEYITSNVKDCLRDISYHTKERDQEIQRCKERTDWIVALKNSLK